MKLDDVEGMLSEIERRKTFRKLDYYDPIPKQKEFHDDGAEFRERMFRANNQGGKTYAGAAEMAMHLTGLYPDWWVGRRFDHPVKAWGASKDGVMVRDGMQTLLFGNPGVADDWGTGLVPKELLIDKSMARGVSDYIDTVQVRHSSGGISTINFKTYESQRKAFQSATRDLVWLDEEPPEDIYDECLARIAATKGAVYLTFTPLLGMSTVVKRFMDEKSLDRKETVMTIWQSNMSRTHSKEDIQKIIDGWPKYQQDARAMAIPSMGIGRVFTVVEDQLAWDCPPFSEIPIQWLKLWAIDVGIGHPFAAVLMAWDRETDMVYILHVIRMKDSQPRDQAIPMKLIGAAVPVAWPQDTTQRSKNDGEPLLVAYRAAGLLMMQGHAQYSDQRGNSTEAAIVDMDDRMKTNRFKVNKRCVEWFEEYRQYHRDEKGLVKINDDIISATQKGMMMLRMGKSVMLGGKAPVRRGGQSTIAKGVDFDVFA